MARNIATEKLIEYLRIKSVHPNPDYDSAIKFIRTYAQEIGFDSYKEIEVAPNRFVCLMSYYGKSQVKRSILLNSHVDVSPVDPKYWKFDPFEARRDEKGNIYARGTQDMKSVGIVHMETVRRIKEQGIRPNRSIHISMVPDEEIGGKTGFLPFIETDEFRQLNVGLSLDEGQVSPTEEIGVYYGERLSWWLYLTFRGRTGHCDEFVEKTAAEKLHKFLNKIFAYREEQKKKFKSTEMKLEDINTVNLTQLSGLGDEMIPGEIKATFDIRLALDTDAHEFKKLILEWIREAEGGNQNENENMNGDESKNQITYKFDPEVFDNAITTLDENKNPWWKAFKESAEQCGVHLSKEVFPGGTDGQYLREKGIPVFGFTPFNNTPMLFHAHNEFLNEKVFLRGLDIMENIVWDLANLP